MYILGLGRIWFFLPHVGYPAGLQACLAEYCRISGFFLAGYWISGRIIRYCQISGQTLIHTVSTLYIDLDIRTDFESNDATATVPMEMNENVGLTDIKLTHENSAKKMSDMINSNCQSPDL